mmetsp:Transcript_19011/g.41886  ORF Transcript_19011/g.41886 Transcript_19011/m.41886 type:complete len:205 (-) Transcript_19011:143-757(-)
MPCESDAVARCGDRSKREWAPPSRRHRCARRSRAPPGRMDWEFFLSPRGRSAGRHLKRLLPCLPPRHCSFQPAPRLPQTRWVSHSRTWPGPRDNSRTPTGSWPPPAALPRSALADPPGNVSPPPPRWQTHYLPLHHPGRRRPLSASPRRIPRCLPSVQRRSATSLPRPLLQIPSQQPAGPAGPAGPELGRQRSWWSRAPLRGAS